MILSNFLLSFVFRKNFYYNSQTVMPESNILIHDLYPNSYVPGNKQYSKILIANSTGLRANPKAELNRVDLIPRTFFQKFTNQFFQETIFLSNSSNESSRYVNKLRTLGIAVYKGNEYRHFLNQFSKDLVSGKIKVEVNSLKNFDNENYLHKHNNQQYLRYVWFKFMNFGQLELKNVFGKTNSNNKLKLINHSLPLFVVANDNQQIIMSESTDQLYYNDMFLKLQSLFFKNKSNSKKLYTGLIFINPEDALEYKNYVESCYCNSTRSIKLRVIPTNMNVYYKFLSVRSKNFEFRLIPDLKEVSDLIYRYRKNANLSFETSQKHGQHYFQGQPIYFIKSFVSKSKNSKTLKNLKYSEYFTQDNGHFRSKAVFLNYQTLVDMWQKFIKDNGFTNLPMVPNIHISNLESFISQSDYKDKCDKVVFLPSLQSYDFIKNYLALDSEKQSGTYRLISNKLVHLKTFCYRILWSLTIRQPVNL